tara:strand:+ start:2707 stop:3096 length:390 start_codon:yes stop_codon:yes gene_type:complete
MRKLLAGLVVVLSTLTSVAQNTCPTQKDKSFTWGDKSGGTISVIIKNDSEFWMSEEAFKKAIINVMKKSDDNIKNTYSSIPKSLTIKYQNKEWIFITVYVDRKNVYSKEGRVTTYYRVDKNGEVINSFN